MRRAGLVHAPGTAREDQGQRVQLPHAFGRDVVADDPGEGVPLADPACDELDVLCSKVEDQNRSRRGIDAASMSFCVLNGRKPADGAERPAIIKPLV